MVDEKKGMGDLRLHLHRHLECLINHLNCLLHRDNKRAEKNNIQYG